MTTPSRQPQRLVSVGRLGIRRVGRVKWWHVFRCGDFGLRPGADPCEVEVSGFVELSGIFDEVAGGDVHHPQRAATVAENRLAVACERIVVQRPDDTFRFACDGPRQLIDYVGVLGCRLRVRARSSVDGRRLSLLMFHMRRPHAVTRRGDGRATPPQRTRRRGKSVIDP
jgi:hypothetical protein